MQIFLLRKHSLFELNNNWQLKTFKIKVTKNSYRTVDEHCLSSVVCKDILGSSKQCTTFVIDNYWVTVNLNGQAQVRWPLIYGVMVIFNI